MNGESHYSPVMFARSYALHTFCITLIFLLGGSQLWAASFSRVILDPGHGGKDKGAIWNGVKESHLNLNVALKVEKMLKAKGIPVTMTRRSDYFIPLPKRAQIANKYRSAIFVSIHYNACLVKHVRGVETFYAGDRARALAYEIQRHLVGKAKMKDRKIRKRPYMVLMQTKCPAVLVECGYISNTRERKLVSQKSHQTKIARAIADGIIRFRK